MTYSLYVRKEGWVNWVQLEEGLDKKEFEWDTTTTPSGAYQLKVVASAASSNDWVASHASCRCVQLDPPRHTRP